MTLPVSNISLQDVQNEYGGSNPISLTEYYANGGLVYPGSVNTYGTPIPSSDTISLGNFVGASRFYIWEFPSSSTWTAPRTETIWLLLVAGGAGGGSILDRISREGAGGGGAGGVYSQSIAVTAGTTYTITIGAGGGITVSTGANGGDSSFIGGVHSITVKGGGGGGGVHGNDAISPGYPTALSGRSGGSGGGACGWNKSTYGQTPGSAIVFAQGNSGGAASEFNPQNPTWLYGYSGGGGGVTGAANQNGGGGAKIDWYAPQPNQWSYSRSFAAGGGGGNRAIDSVYNLGNGGQPFGDQGYSRAATFGLGAATPGVPNSGCGGGGGGSGWYDINAIPGAPGGSGICVIWAAVSVPAYNTYQTQDRSANFPPPEPEPEPPPPPPPGPEAP